jgi:hypothetical protein
VSCDVAIIVSAGIVGPLALVIAVADVFTMIAGCVVIYTVGCVIVITEAMGGGMVVLCISLNVIKILPSAVLP